MELSIDHALILFAYGLVFFALGLVVALFSRRTSRLELARSLKWLAAFGLLHGLNEWSELFILAYTSQLEPDTYMLLQVMQLILLATSFACLLQFGISLLNPFIGIRGLSLLPALLGVGLFIIILSLQCAPENFQTWHRTGVALTRYGIGLPGALLAVYGLRRQANEVVSAENFPGGNF